MPPLDVTVRLHGLFSFTFANMKDGDKSGEYGDRGNISVPIITNNFWGIAGGYLLFRLI